MIKEEEPPKPSTRLSEVGPARRGGPISRQAGSTNGPQPRPGGPSRSSWPSCAESWTGW